MAEHSTQTRLRARLAGELGSAVSEALIVRLAEVADRSDTGATVLTLLDELDSLSAKAARAAIAALPELARRAGVSHLIYPFRVSGKDLGKDLDSDPAR